MTSSTRVMSRRTFLRDLGHGAFALTVIWLAGCARGPVGTVGPVSTLGPSGTVGRPRSFDPLTYVGNLDEIEAFWCESDLPSPPASQVPSGSAAPNAMPWARIGNQRASGYVLVRGGEAVVVDTGPWCVPGVIEDALMAVGLGWSAVGSVIVTHKHPDHWVGLSSALERATDAVVFAGAADIPHIASPRPIVPVGAGDRVMDLAIIPTPGHTPGHIAVHDEAAGVLVVGDAINYGEGHGFILLGTSEDVPQTQASVGILAGLSFDTLLPGHGDPIIGGAREALAEYLVGT
ncbi:MAG TPA: MBL fold metallo-hydrolase [Candidatus Limnocylindria bacterium]|nr:MBL fold metallo-hydrolase [Candidatus Limnocylindria bacterium]